ncbi:hypothetical protein HZA87_00770 [Candidatus Uhrbacteria bacterium]|nr:hypothetical protein [Candidatus Uhrbacteria bacterium]
MVTKLSKHSKRFIIGVRIATTLSPFWLQRVFGFIMLAISIHMIVGKR